MLKTPTSLFFRAAFHAVSWLSLAAATTAISIAHAASPPAQVVLRGERIFPESITSSKDGSLFFSSLGGHGVFRAQPGSAVADVWVKAGAAEGLALTLGVLADDKAGVLWTCSRTLAGSQPGGSPVTSSVFALDLKKGTVRGAYPLSGEGAGCNDIAVDSVGNIYVTDSAQMLVLKLPKGGKALQMWAGVAGELGPRGGVLDGIAVLGDEVFVNTLATGKFFSIAIGKNGAAGAVTELTLDRAVERPDGMRSHGKNELLVTESGGNGKVSVITLNGHSGKVTTLREGLAGGPVSVTEVGNTLYVLEGQLAFRRPEVTAQPGPFKATAIEWPASGVRVH